MTIVRNTGVAPAKLTWHHPYGTMIGGVFLVAQPNEVAERDASADLSGTFSRLGKIITGPVQIPKVIVKHFPS